MVLQATITATVVEITGSTSWQGTMQLQLASILTNLVSRMIGVTPEKLKRESVIGKVLASPLFSGGISNSALHSLLEVDTVMNPALVAAAQVPELGVISNVDMQSSVPQVLIFLMEVVNCEHQGSKLLSAAGYSLCTGSASSALFACIVHHGGLVEDALASAASGVASGALTKALAKAISMHKELGKAKAEGVSVEQNDLHIVWRCKLLLTGSNREWKYVQSHKQQKTGMSRRPTSTVVDSNVVESAAGWGSLRSSIKAADRLKAMIQTKVPLACTSTDTVLMPVLLFRSRRSL